MVSGFLLLLGTILSALGRRFQGGLLTGWINSIGAKYNNQTLAKIDIGSAPVRALWGVLVALVAYLCFAPLLLCGALAIGIFIGSTAGYWGSMTTGTISGGRSEFLGYSSLKFWKDMGFLSLHGLIGVIIPVIALWWFSFSFIPVLIAGLFCGPVYRLSYIWCWNIPILGCLNNEKDFDPPPTAELIYGGLIGLGVVISLLKII